jgi:hypothetical protein
MRSDTLFGLVWTKSAEAIKERSLGERKELNIITLDMELVERVFILKWRAVKWCGTKVERKVIARRTSHYDSVALKLILSICHH